MTLAEALVVLRRLPHTQPLDVREVTAVRTVCEALAEQPPGANRMASELGD